LAVYRQSDRLGVKPLQTHCQNFIYQLNTCGHGPYVTSSLMRGWICRLQLLLALAAHSFSGPSPAGLMTTFYCLRFETPPTWSPGPASNYPTYNISARSTQQTPFFYCCVGVRCRGNMLTEPLFRNGLHNPFVLLSRAYMMRALPSNGRCLQSNETISHTINRHYII
jgi:hypothetical protein